MKKLLSLLCILLSLSFAYGQKTINDVNAEKREVAGFHAIEVSGGIEAVAVSASKTEYRERIITKVENGVLKIRFEWNNNYKMDWGNRKLKAYVSCNQLDYLHASGGSDIDVDGSFKTAKLDLHISGGSDFSGNLVLNELIVEASGGSDVFVSGKADKLSIDASGGSDFKGYELATDICNVRASGGSDVFITVNKELSANASGGSDVFYKGTGLIRDIKTSGSSIKKVSK
jgi:Putative auto-transporter adhesin, head GIN domain